MRQVFKLSKTEQQQEWILTILGVLSFIVIGFGVYYQNHDIDKDFVLVPLIGTIYFFFFLLLGTNGIKGGNLLPKWIPLGILEIIAFVISKITNKSTADVKPLTQKILGTAGLVTGLFFAIVAFMYVLKG